MYNEYQTYRVKKLLESDFKKQYDLIPIEYKQNYYFEHFIFNLADIYYRIIFSEEEGYKSNENFPLEFKTNEKTTYVDTSCYGEDVTDKRIMEVDLTENGTLHFKWTQAFVAKDLDKRAYNSYEDDLISELTMKQDEDKQNVFVKYRIQSVHNNEELESTLYSMFDNTINEICRVSEGFNKTTNQTLYHEEFIPVGNIEKEVLQKFKKEAEQKKIQVIGLFGGEAFIQERKYQQDIKEVYVAKCISDGITRYALCWKPECYVDNALNASFQSISKFMGPYYNLSETLDANETPWLIEISEEEYNYFINNKKNDIDVKKLLK